MKVAHGRVNLRIQSRMAALPRPEMVDAAAMAASAANVRGGRAWSSTWF